MTSPAITVLGLGNLGAALAGTFLDHGHRVTVWNRTPAKADPLVARGAARAATAAEAVAAGDLVVVCVLDYAAAHALLAPAAGALEGRTLVNVTSGIPEEVRELAAWAERHGAGYVDGAVYAVPQTVGTDRAFVVYSGSPEVFEPHRGTLSLLGDPVFAGAAPELAAVYDVAVLSGMYGMFAGFFQTVAVAGSAGIGAARITGPLVRWLREAADVLPLFADEIDAGDYATRTSTLDINAGGLANILKATRAQGVPTGLLAPLADLFDRQIAEGHGRASLSRAVHSLRDPASYCVLPGAVRSATGVAGPRTPSRNACSAGGSEATSRDESQ